MSFSAGLERGVIRIRFRGVLTGEDLRALAEEMLQMERAQPRAPDRIIEFTEVEAAGMDLSFTQIADLAEHRKSIDLANPIRTALVTNEPVKLGFARMWQTLNDHPDITVRIFETTAAAEEWISHARGGPGL